MSALRLTSLRSILILFFGFSLLAFGALQVWNGYQIRQRETINLDVASRFGGGTLMICGGGRLPQEVRKEFVEMAGGSKAILVVLPAYQARPDEIRDLEEWWKKQGIGSVKVLHAESREEALKPEFSESLQKATAVWLTGGDQAVLAGNYSGTPVEERIIEVIARGGIVGGTSAGAAIMSKRMIEQGSDKPIEAAGFDLLTDSIIDQHFLRRNRLQRMHKLLEKYPGITGFGIDEGTAFVVNIKRGRVIVLGDSYVCAVTPAHDKKEHQFTILKHGDECSMDGIRTGSELISSRIELQAHLSWE